MKYKMKRIFLFSYACALCGSRTIDATNIELKVNNHTLSCSINGKEINAVKKTMQNVISTLPITGIISTISAGMALLKNTYQRLTKSEKKLVKKCIMVFVALWIVSTYWFWVCLYAVGKFLYQFHDKRVRQHFFSSIEKTIATISNKITVH